MRPGVLDELGLISALRSLAAEFTDHGLTVRPELRPGLPPLPQETELVLYRVAQEALTNTARHSGADHAELRLRPAADGVELLVRDNGSGLDGTTGEGAGIRGMRERALLIGTRLVITSGPAPGGGRGPTAGVGEAGRRGAADRLDPGHAGTEIRLWVLIDP